MSEKWTVGRWTQTTEEYLEIENEDGRVAWVWPGVDDSGPDTEARARLIAAAPALRDALRAVMAAMPGQWDWCQDYDYEPSALEACGVCSGCVAWQAAHDALALVEPSNA